MGKGWTIGWNVVNEEQLCADTECSLEDLPGAMDDRDGWRKSVWKSVLAEWHDDDDDC